MDLSVANEMEYLWALTHQMRQSLLAELPRHSQGLNQSGLIVERTHSCQHLEHQKSLIQSTNNTASVMMDMKADQDGGAVSKLATERAAGSPKSPH